MYISAYISQKNGDSGRTRTPNLLIRSELLYPVELRNRRSCHSDLYRHLSSIYGDRMNDNSVICTLPDHTGTIRALSNDDIAAVTAIYGHHVETSTASF